METTVKQISLSEAVKIIEMLEKISEVKCDDIKQTLTNGTQYAKNVVLTFETDVLEKNIKMLNLAHKWIDHPVYKRIKSPTEKYQFYKEAKSIIGDFNPTEREPIIFTCSLFTTFVSDYLNY